MAVTANQVVKRQGRDGKLGYLGCAAAMIFYEGTACYLDAAGAASNVINTDVGKFLGIVRQMVDNSAGAALAKTVEFWRDGVFELPFAAASLVAADINKTAYGVDNFDFSETATDQPEVGKIVNVLSTTRALVEIKGIGEGIVAPGT